MPLFAALLYDADDRVRMEAPEMFRVLGKRRPELVRPYLERLQRISETDRNRVVRLHCLGDRKPRTGGCVAIPMDQMYFVMQHVSPDCVVVIDSMEHLGADF